MSFLRVKYLTFSLFIICFSLCVFVEAFAQGTTYTVPEGDCPAWSPSNDWDKAGVHLPCRSDEMTGYKTLQTREGALDKQQKIFVRTMDERVGLTYDYAEKITYILAGFGMLGMVLMAAIGHWSWKWFFALCGGLFILAGFQAVIYFIS